MAYTTETLSSVFGSLAGNEIRTSSRRQQTSKRVRLHTQEVLPHLLAALPTVPHDWLHAAMDLALIQPAGSGPYRGAKVLEHGILLTLSAYADLVGSIDKPEIIYMLGYHIFHAVSEKHEALNQSLRLLPERQFTSEDMREKAKTREQAQLDLLDLHKNSLSDALEIFAKTMWGEDAETFQHVLRTLSLTSFEQLSKRERIHKEHVQQLFKQGRINELHSLLAMPDI